MSFATLLQICMSADGRAFNGNVLLHCVRTLASNAANWRTGRQLTRIRFAELWDAYFQFVPGADRPSTPTPMLFAAALFTKLFLTVRLAKRNLTFVPLDRAFYMHSSKIQRQALTAARSRRSSVTSHGCLHRACRARTNKPD